MKVSVENGIPGWSRAALDLLQTTAGSYNSTLGSSQFAELIQARSGRWANVASQGWVRKVLAVVSLKCERESWPHLASLVVRPSDGRIGPWYQDVLALTGPGSAADEHEHAAKMRLDCYRFFGADVPRDATPILRPALRSAAPKPRPQRVDGDRQGHSSSATIPDAGPAAPSNNRDRHGDICPSCFMQMPLTGECANCS